MENGSPKTGRPLSGALHLCTWSIQGKACLFPIDPKFGAALFTGSTAPKHALHEALDLDLSVGSLLTVDSSFRYTVLGMLWCFVNTFITFGLRDLPRKLDRVGNINFGTDNLQNGRTNVSTNPRFVWDMFKNNRRCVETFACPCWAFHVPEFMLPTRSSFPDMSWRPKVKQKRHKIDDRR